MSETERDANVREDWGGRVGRMGGWEKGRMHILHVRTRIIDYGEIVISA